MILKRKLFSSRLHGYREPVTNTHFLKDLISKEIDVSWDDIDKIKEFKDEGRTIVEGRDINNEVVFQFSRLGPDLELIYYRDDNIKDEPVKEEDKFFSAIDRITDKLDRAGYDDYEVVNKIARSSISINTDLKKLQIYLPKDYEYDQYEIDDFLRGLPGFIRTKTVLDRDIYVMTVNGRLTEDQYIRLLKYIIDEEEFVSIIEEE